MNGPERAELDQLKQRHAALQQELSLLAAQLKSLENRLQREPVFPSPPATTPGSQPVSFEDAKSPAPSPATPPPLPPLIKPSPTPAAAPAATLSPNAPAPTPTVSSASPVASTAATAKTFEPLATKISPAPSPPSQTVSAEKSSLEMRLGTYWLVRIGVVMLLTGLVFFGNYAYQNFIGRIGPAGKVTLLYLASGILLGAGAWWQRRSARESLKNYAQVLFAGGMAAVYFTTYAAHHIPNLQIISNALLDGALLLGWAAFMVWIADRKKSEVLALFAIGLAYYTSVITRVGSFSLYSNLVLTATAVLFLVRNRWAALSYASLVATYASYAFWRFFQAGDGWRWTSPETGLWHGTYFLVAYWVVFTTAVFFSRHEKFAGGNRATFLTFNNGAFFGLFLLTLLLVRSDDFGKFFLIYGTVLLALAAVARQIFPDELITKNSYLTQGLLLVTLGFVVEFAGLQLALVLGAESVVLFVLGMQRKSLVLQTGGIIAGAMAVGWGIDGLERNQVKGIWLGGTLGAFMTVNSFWSARRSLEGNVTRPDIRPLPAYFFILAQIIWFATTWFNVGRENLPLMLAVETVGLTASIYVFRMREWVILSQGFLLLAHLLCADSLLTSVAPLPWWNPLFVLGVTLTLSHWWQRQKLLQSAASGVTFQCVYALAIVALICFWLEPSNTAPHWLVLTSALAVIFTAYGVFTRSWFLAGFAQLFLLVSIWEFLRHLTTTASAWQHPLAPIAALGLLSAATVRWFACRPDSKPAVRDTLLKLAIGYRWLALVFFIVWIFEYIPARERVWVYFACGLAAFVVAGWRRNREALLFSLVFSIFGLAMFWSTGDRVMLVYWPNLVALLGLAVQQQLIRRQPARYALDDAAEITQTALIVFASVSLWRFVTSVVLLNASGFYLTASWSVLALMFIGGGIALRERVYRWAGLVVLAAALGRVVIFDVWKLETIYRVLSFMALGLVLLVLGFLYTRFQEKIRQWL